jgi:hypothetical protein
MTYNAEGKRTSLENLAGQIAATVAQGEGGLWAENGHDIYSQAYTEGPVGS